MAVSKRLRYEVLRRDNHACRYCGATAPDVKLNVDHVIPTSLGGNDKPTNLVTSCADCNSGKTSSLPNADPIADVDQETFRRAAELPTPEKVRSAFHSHLIGVWTWAWNKRSETEPTQKQQEDAFANLAIISDGSDFTADFLTEVAFKAGSARSTEVASFIDPELSTEQFSLGADAVLQWESSWIATTGGAKPSGDEVAEFCNDLHCFMILVDARTKRGFVLAAAKRAGACMDTSIIRHLSDPESANCTVGGER